MKLKDGFILHDVGGEHMAIATGDAGRDFNGLIRNNETAHFIFKKLLSETTVEEIVESMADEYDAPVSQITADVNSVVQKLRESGFLEE